MQTAINEKAGDRRSAFFSQERIVLAILDHLIPLEQHRIERVTRALPNPRQVARDLGSHLSVFGR